VSELFFNKGVKSTVCVLTINFIKKNDYMIYVIIDVTYL